MAFPMPSVYIKTYGCQMNERDSEQVAYMFVSSGYSLAQCEEEADIVLMNTCSVREKAELKAIGKMGLLTARKDAPRHVVYGIMGCMAQSRGNGLFRELPRLDLVIGTQKYHRVFELVDELLKKRLAQGDVSTRKGAHRCETNEEVNSQNTIRDHLPKEVRSTAYVSIMQGCEMKCSYCIVPSTRGVERSRPASEIIEEVRRLVDNGVREITLLGQIVNLYGKAEPKVQGKTAFVRLLEDLCEIDGLARLRFTSPHPIGFGKDLVEAYRYLPKLCSHIHFPMQSGSDRILKMMRRPYRNEKYLRLCEELREARPDLAITTDIIVGFPGETDEDYLETKRAVERIRFDNAFIFQYSPRKDTPAAVMPDQIPLRLKEARNHDLLQTVNAIAIAKNAQLVGTEQDVLIEGPSKSNAEKLSGRTPQNKPVILEGTSDLIGQIVPVKITESTGFTLYGSLIDHK